MEHTQAHSMPEEQHAPLAPAYPYYPGDQEAPYSLTYPSMGTYHQAVQPHGTPTRGSLDLSHPQQQMGFHNMNMMSPHQYTGPVYAPHTPHGLGLSNSPPPPSPDLYEALSPPASDSNNSVDGVYHSLSSGGNSPSSSRGNSLVHRHIRYNPSPSPTSSAGRRHNRSRSRDSDEEGMGVSFVENLAHTRKEATRRQRIEAEQRRRDELRDGYAKLKDVLPVSTQKSSKVSLLERATNYIVTLESNNKELLDRITALEQEVARLRTVNEKISLHTNETPSPNMMDAGRSSPLSSEVAVPFTKAEQASSKSSPSPSDGGY